MTALSSQVSDLDGIVKSLMYLSRQADAAGLDAVAAAIARALSETGHWARSHAVVTLANTDRDDRNASLEFLERFIAASPSTQALFLAATEGREDDTDVRASA